MKIEKMEPFGAKILDIDLSDELDQETVDKLYEAICQNNFVVVPDQDLTPTQQAEFSARFGPLIPHASYEYNHPENDKVLIISNIKENGKPLGIDDAGSYWHSDFSYIPKPSFATILHAIEVPEGRGDTLFIDMYAAYEGLSDEMKARVKGLSASHRHVIAGGRWAREFRPDGIPQSETELSAVLDESFNANPAVEHPIVKEHADTGRKCLYVHPCFTQSVVGLSEQDSDDLLRELFTHMTRPEFQTRHKWHVGDVVMWDNRCTTHAATTSALPTEFRRRIHRTSVEAHKF